MSGLHSADTGLYLVDLDLPLPGFRDFIGCWIYHRQGKTIVVDPGPASTIQFVFEALNQLQVKSLDLILLTHIHLDHAGGTGHLVERFPDTPVVCHPIAIPHLTDPKRLWEGSLKVLGKIAQTYGALKSVPVDRLFSIYDKLSNNFRIQIFETPGHASHHVCYVVDELLFAGEVAGVMLPVSAVPSDELRKRAVESRPSLPVPTRPGQNPKSGEAVPPTNPYYLRIATPPVFKYSVYRNSLLKAAKIKAEKICFGHYGLQKYSGQIFKQAEIQLELWTKIIRGFSYPIDDKEYDKILAIILREDPSLQMYELLPRDIQERERYFCLNSIKGIHGYILG